jgi:hypothetical protein
MNIESMTREEKSQLLFLEACCVDNRGLIDGRRMNSDDVEISRQWDASGYIKFGRLRIEAIKGVHNYAVRLSDEAFDDAAKLRRAKAGRTNGALVDDVLCGTREPHALDAVVEVPA